MVPAFTSASPNHVRIYAAAFLPLRSSSARESGVGVNQIFMRKNGSMREVHAPCVKISRNRPRRYENVPLVLRFIRVFATHAVQILVGIGIAIDFPELGWQRARSE